MNKIEKILMVVAFALSLGVLALFLIQAEWGLEKFLSPNVLEYYRPAQNMVAHGAYSMDAAPPLSPSRFRPPLWPVVMAATYAAFGQNGLYLILILNSIFFAYAVMLLYRLGAVFLPGRWALAPAVLLLLDPMTLRYNASLLADSLATMLILIIMLRIVRAWQTPTLKNAAVLGLAITVGIYARPNLEFLLLPAVIALGIRAAGWKKLPTALLVIICTLAPLLPWQIRNYHAFGNTHFSSLDWTYLYYFGAPYVLGASEGRPWRAVRDEKLLPAILAKYPAGSRIAGELVELHAGGFVVGSFLVPEALAIIKPHPGAALKVAAAGLARFFIDDGYHELAYALVPSSTRTVGVYNLISTGRVGAALRDLVSRDGPVVISMVVGKILWVIFYLGIILGTIAATRKKIPPRYGRALGIIFILLLMFGAAALPVTESRHRVLYQPLFYLWAATGWAAWAASKKALTDTQ